MFFWQMSFVTKNKAEEGDYDPNGETVAKPDG
jgi:hypothetical protein